MTVTSELHTQKDKERLQRIESDIQWGLKDPESKGKSDDDVRKRNDGTQNDREERRVGLV